MLPNYLVIGAQKCATSSLCHLLGQHPDVFMTEPKEPYFFSHPHIWEKGWGWYESLFGGAENCAAIGEGSTTYTQHHLYPGVPGRIAEHLPEVRLIYIVRDPLERMKSHWMHLRARENREPRSFNVAVRERPEYIDNSRYDHQLGFYREHFDEARILVLFLEDFQTDTLAALRRCYEFLAVDPTPDIEYEDEPQHVSSHGRVDTTVTKVLRRVPGFRGLRDLAPGGLREVMRKTFKRPIGQRPQWDEATRAWAIEQLADETRQLLGRYGKPEDFWPWLSTAPTRRAG